MHQLYEWRLLDTQLRERRIGYVLKQPVLDVLRESKCGDVRIICSSLLCRLLCLYWKCIFDMELRGNDNEYFDRCKDTSGDQCTSRELEHGAGCVGCAESEIAARDCLAAYSYS